jgi:hypothetical protein
LDGLRSKLTTPSTNRDPEEKRRLAELVSGLGKIERRSKELLEKVRATPSVDKGKDSGDVAKLVGQFQEVIACYQVSEKLILLRVCDSHERIDITTASDLRQDHEPCGEYIPVSLRFPDDRCHHSVILRYALETPREIASSEEQARFCHWTVESAVLRGGRWQ